jgi:hypothetical protein
VKEVNVVLVVIQDLKVFVEEMVIEVQLVILVNEDIVVQEDILVKEVKMVMHLFGRVNG